MTTGAAGSELKRKLLAPAIQSIQRWWARLRQPTRSTWAAVCLLAGYLIQQTHWTDLAGWFVTLIVAMIALCCSRWGRQRGWRVLGFVLVLLAIGGLWSELREPGHHPLFQQLIPQDSEEIRVIRVRGTVTSITPSPPQKPRDLFESFRFTIPKVKFVVQTEAYETPQGWEPLHGRLDCTLESPQSLDEVGVAQVDAVAETRSAVDVGQQVEMLGRISLPPMSKNPRQLDYRRYMWLNGIDGQLTMNHPEQIEVTRKEWVWTSGGDRLRQYFKMVLRRHLEDEQYPLAAAILLGDRSMLDFDLRQQYAATGTVHVLAISGLHLGILAGAVLWWSRWSFIPQRPVLVGTILLVLFYAWLVEFRPPIVRAAVLTTIMCIATLIGRRALSFNSLAVALVVVFAIQPHQIAEAGTQLSFLAVAGIVLYAQHRSRIVPTPLQELRESRYTTVERVGWSMFRAVREVYLCGLAVFVAGLPLVIHYFNLLAWIGLLINPLVILPMTLALLSGFAVLVTAPLSGVLADGFGWTCGTSLDVMNGIVEWSYVLPGSYVWVTSPGWGWIVI